jgi:hypothetical protein
LVLGSLENLSRPSRAALPLVSHALRLCWKLANSFYVAFRISVAGVVSVLARARSSSSPTVAFPKKL